MNEQSPNKPTRVEKPWGYELIFAHTDKYAGKELFIKQGCKLSLQFHEKKDESIFIASGELKILLGNANEAMTSYTLKKGDCVRIPPLKRHRMEAVKDTSVFEVSSPELDDVKRLQDDYGRI